MATLNYPDAITTLARKLGCQPATVAIGKHMVWQGVADVAMTKKLLDIIEEQQKSDMALAKAIAEVEAQEAAADAAAAPASKPATVEAQEAAADAAAAPASKPATAGKPKGRRRQSA